MGSRRAKQQSRLAHILCHLFHVEVNPVQNSTLINDEHRQLLEYGRQIFNALHCRQDQVGNTEEGDYVETT